MWSEVFLLLSTIPVIFKFLEKDLILLKTGGSIKMVPISKVEGLLKSSFNPNHICQIKLPKIYQIYLLMIGKKSFEVMENLILEEIAPSYDQNLACLEIPRQNIWNEINKSS